MSGLENSQTVPKLLVISLGLNLGALSINKGNDNLLNVSLHGIFICAFVKTTVYCVLGYTISACATDIFIFLLVLAVLRI